MKLSLALLSVIAAAQAAYVPSDPWSTLTPSKTATVGITDHTAKFGISIQTLASTLKSGVKVPAATTKAAAKAAPKAAPKAGKRDVINQIGDGQIQHQPNKPQPKPKPRPTVASIVNQIGDGQIQNQTNKPKPKPKPRPTVASVVNQIGDGQIQNQTNKPKPKSKPTTASVANQIGDGQIQHKTGAGAAPQTKAQATGVPTADQITDGFPVACLTSDSLSMTLKGGILTDSLNRVGAIVANYQFQFDGPPQAGTIYAAGWSITPKGLLALGGDDLFYQCKSGDFYNLYYFEKASDINAQCEPVHLSVIELVKC